MSRGAKKERTGSGLGLSNVKKEEMKRSEEKGNGRRII